MILNLESRISYIVGSKAHFVDDMDHLVHRIPPHILLFPADLVDMAFLHQSLVMAFATLLCVTLDSSHLLSLHADCAVSGFERGLWDVYQGLVVC